MRWIANLIRDFFFFLAVKWGKVRGSKQTGVAIKKKLSVTQTKFAVGESYKLGCATVTVCASKQEVQERIAAAKARRAARMAALTKKAEKMMLMSEEELLQFKINEWLESRATEAGKRMDFSGTDKGVRLKPPSSSALN